MIPWPTDFRTDFGDTNIQVLNSANEISVSDLFYNFLVSINKLNFQLLKILSF